MRKKLKQVTYICNCRYMKIRRSKWYEIKMRWASKRIPLRLCDLVAVVDPWESASSRLRLAFIALLSSPLQLKLPSQRVLCVGVKVLSQANSSISPWILVDCITMLKTNFYSVINSLILWMSRILNCCFFLTTSSSFSIFEFEIHFVFILGKTITARTTTTLLYFLTSPSELSHSAILCWFTYDT